MFSNSNAYLGAGSQRPGAQQYGSPFNNLGQGAVGQQPSPSPFAPQPTGFGQQPPLQQQYTGFPGQAQPLQQQYTGMPGPVPQQQGFQTGAPPMPSMPPQFQQQQQQPIPQGLPPPQSTGFASPQQSSGPTQPPASAIKPQATGFHEMAASFQAGGTAKPQGRRGDRPTNKIPNIRLSFITAQDQAKFETLFKSAVGEGSTTMSGEKARDLLLRSRLDGDSLSHIW